MEGSAEKHLEDLLSRLNHVGEGVRAAAEDPRIHSVSLWLWSRGQPFGLELSPQELHRIQDLGAALKIDVPDTGELNDVIPAEPRVQADLAQRWSAMLDFSRYDRPDDPGAWNLIFSLRSIEEACRKLLGFKLHEATSASEGADLRDALQDVGLELDHMLYHILDARFSTSTFTLRTTFTPATAVE